MGMRLQVQPLYLQVDSTIRSESLATQSGYAEHFFTLTHNTQ